MNRTTLLAAGLLTVAALSGLTPAHAATQGEQTIFYTGDGKAGADSAAPTGAYVMTRDPDSRSYESWKGTSECNSNRAVPDRTTRTFNRLVGYSSGRLGPPYYLQQYEQKNQISTIRSVIVLDPGAGGELYCDNASGAGRTYATWLRQNPANKLLMILAQASAADGYTAVRSIYVNQLTADKVGPNVGDRVLICEAPSVAHDKVDDSFASLIGKPTQTSCPNGTTLSRYSPKNAAPVPTPVPAPIPGPAPTFAETTGGATNTWTNYSNAGGSQGPTIGSNVTVQVACKLQGFRVADGNTWWYRIASSPWNNTYYASADAFYNNGQTSGSLRGTPFVDATVRDC